LVGGAGCRHITELREWMLRYPNGGQSYTSWIRSARRADVKVVNVERPDVADLRWEEWTRYKETDLSTNRSTNAVMNRVHLLCGSGLLPIRHYRLIQQSIVQTLETSPRTPISVTKVYAEIQIVIFQSSRKNVNDVKLLNYNWSDVGFDVAVHIYLMFLDRTTPLW